MSWLVKAVLDWIFGRLTDWLGGLYRLVMRQKKVEEEAKESVKPLKDAVTPEELDEATHDALDKL